MNQVEIKSYEVEINEGTPELGKEYIIRCPGCEERIIFFDFLRVDNSCSCSYAWSVEISASAIKQDQ